MLRGGARERGERGESRETSKSSERRDQRSERRRADERAREVAATAPAAGLVLAAAGSLGLLAGAAEASLVLGSPGTPAVVDFTGFDGSGFSPAPAPGQLDSDTWRVTGMSDGDGAFGGTYDFGDFARGASSGAVSSGGVYAFEVAPGDVGLGVQPTGSVFTEGSFTLRVRNETGLTVDDLAVAY
jgi:hypothetical protein